MVIPIAVIYGDGIGPEIMDAVLMILNKAEVDLSVETIEAGEKAYKKHLVNGISEAAWDVFSRTKAILKAPLYTPSGGGYRSVNVSIRKRLGLYVNLRPISSYYPFIKNSKLNMDVVIVRENEEGSYIGVEYRRSPDVFEGIRTITVFNSLRIAYYGFEYAKKFNRKRVDCFVKDNIMKMTDGCFYEMFQKVASRYSDIENGKYIVDIGMAKLAASPQAFDVIVTTNLYGDIASDVAAEVAGSVGVAGSANIGDNCAMFEAVHGTAPDIAERNIANPSGLLNAAVMMLAHLGYCDKADIVKNAWLKTIESGIHTKDMAHDDTKKIVGTAEFAKEVINNLGNKPKILKPSQNGNTGHILSTSDLNNFNIEKIQSRRLVGADIEISINDQKEDFVPDLIADKINDIINQELMLCVIFCKGLKIWPDSFFYKGMRDCCTLRIASKDVGDVVSYNLIFSFIKKIPLLDFTLNRVDFLFTFDDKPGFAFAE